MFCRHSDGGHQVRIDLAKSCGVVHSATWPWAFFGLVVLAIVMVSNGLCWLVIVWLVSPTPLKNMSESHDDIPNMMGKIIHSCSKAPTRSYGFPRIFLGFSKPPNQPSSFELHRGGLNRIPKSPRPFQ